MTDSSMFHVKQSRLLALRRILLGRTGLLLLAEMCIRDRGQGEPFLNYDNTMAALRILNHKKGLEIGARHISVSTCGILPGLELSLINI